MNLAVEAPLWIVLVFAGLLIAAAVEDAVRLRISNITCAFILIAGVVAAVLAGPTLSLWQNLAVFAALLLAGMPLFAAGKFGGGDVKLFGCVGLWLDFSGALYFIASALIAGGLLALLILGTRLFRWRESLRRRVGILRRGSGIPYGVAIAAGALVTLALQRG